MNREHPPHVKLFAFFRLWFLIRFGCLAWKARATTLIRRIPLLSTAMARIQFFVFLMSSVVASIERCLGGSPSHARRSGRPPPSLGEEKNTFGKGLSLPLS